MRISIITPSYNQGIFIEDAIQSVLDQEYDDFEHIIVDGGSTDDTVERLKKYPHLIWISERDQGQSDALNKGFKMATGDLIGWLNCDDFYLPGAFKKAVGELKSENVDGVYSNLMFCDRDKKILDRYRSNKPSKLLSLFHTYITSETLFFRRKVLDRNIQVDTTLVNCMDQDFVATLLYNGFKLKYINTYFSVFRWQGENKSMNTPEVKRKRITEGIHIFNKHIRRIKVNPSIPVHRMLYASGILLMKPYRLLLRALP